MARTATTTPTSLVWFRNDLRVHAQPALAAALAQPEPVRALYLLCPGQWDAHHVAPLRRWYVLESLRELAASLARLGVPLDVIRLDRFAEVPARLRRYWREHGSVALYACREYPLNELNRDRAVADEASKAGVTVHGFDGGMLVPPKQLKTGGGTPYTVFTPYRRRWQVWLAEQPPACPAPESTHKPIAPPPLKEVDRAVKALAVPASLTASWQPGEQAARRQLADFAAEPLRDYRRQRDFPALSGTSLLSTALSAGTLAASECWQLAQQALMQPGWRDGVECWLGELAWRDFYRQIMANFPQLAWGAPFRPETRLIRWRDDEAGFAAWCEGRTGYPLVDAAQRQLLSCGWMHNRLRMVSAMFLSKHLFIDWRRGEQFFMQHLIDGDFAANNGGWQWSASTGTDAAPYFRVFSPIRQSERFDAEGDFIRQHVSELAELPAPLIHQPWKKPALAPGYPAQVVPHEGVRERVTEAFRQVRDIAQQGQGGAS